MPKILSRIIATLLVPILVWNPVAATGVISEVPNPVVLTTNTRSQIQFLAVEALAARPALICAHDRLSGAFGLLYHAADPAFWLGRSTNPHLGSFLQEIADPIVAAQPGAIKDHAAEVLAGNETEGSLLNAYGFSEFRCIRMPDG